MTQNRAFPPLEVFDIAVVGAGPAGLAAALACAQRGFKVICLDRSAPPEWAPETWDDAENLAQRDLRSAALLQPSVKLMESLGAWEKLSQRATALVTMRIWDSEQGAPLSVEFDAKEIDQPAFGWNIATGEIRAALGACARSAENLEIAAPATLRTIAYRADAARLNIETPQGEIRRISASLVVGADGRNSQTRMAAKIQTRKFDHGQRAIAFHVTHERPHQNISTEIYKRGGPFTLVPHLAKRFGRHCSSVVWMESVERANDLMALSAAAFSEAATARSDGVLGDLTLVEENQPNRAAWPIVSMLAENFHAPRLALMAEAAHVSPPIGAQGLNMSLADANLLAEILYQARKAGEDIGSKEVLAPYERVRWRDVAARLAAAATLDHMAIGALAPARLLRRFGLNMLSSAGPLRQQIMRMGMGG